MSEEEFDKIADTFRDPKVWWKNEKGEWVKDNIWDEDNQYFPIVSFNSLHNERKNRNITRIPKVYWY